MDKEDIKCTKCKSSNVHVGQRGFHAGQALAGAALFLGIGFIFGFWGASDVQFTCLNCGHKFDLNEKLGHPKKGIDWNTVGAFAIGTVVLLILLYLGFR